MERYTNTDCKPEMEELMKDCPRSRSGAECWLRLCDIEDILGDEYDLDQLREMVEADREGRSVVRKFAPGSEVWIVERDEDGEATEVSGYVFVVSVSGIAIVSPSINDCSDLDFILSDFVEETASGFSGSFSGYPISDCYKSHEDAETALRREQE